MNTKKKILSFALACLMIVMTFSAAIPAFAEVKATDVCKIGDTGYATLALALAEREGQTIELLKDIEIEGDVTIAGTSTSIIKTASDLNKKVTVTVKDGTIYSSAAGNVTFQNINFVEEVTDDSNAKCLIAIRNKCTYTFENCDFTVSGNTGATNGQDEAYFTASNNGGTINMVGCTITCNETTYDNPVFGAYANSVALNIKLDDVDVKVKNTATPIFALYKNTDSRQIFVKILGDTNFKYVDSENAETAHSKVFTETTRSDRKGGTVNILNGRTYGSYAAPELMDGASIRISEQGLRFTIADVSNLGATYGMLFAKDSDTWNNTTFVLDAENTVSASADGTGLNDTSYNMVLTGATLNQKYAARAYAQYTDCGGATITVYSAFDATKNVRSMSNIANYIVTNNTESAGVIATLKTTYGIN